MANGSNGRRVTGRATRWTACCAGSINTETCTQHLHGSITAVRQGPRGWALIHNFAPSCARMVRESPGLRSPAERLNVKRHRPEWIAGSAGFSVTRWVSQASIHDQAAVMREEIRLEAGSVIMRLVLTSRDIHLGIVAPCILHDDRFHLLYPDEVTPKVDIRSLVVKLPYISRRSLRCRSPAGSRPTRLVCRSSHRGAEPGKHPRRRWSPRLTQTSHREENFEC